MILVQIELLILISEFQETYTAGQWLFPGNLKGEHGVLHLKSNRVHWISLVHPMCGRNSMMHSKIKTNLNEKSSYIEHYATAFLNLLLLVNYYLYITDLTALTVFSGLGR